MSSSGQGFKGSFLSIEYITVLPVSQFRPAAVPGPMTPTFGPFVPSVLFAKHRVFLRYIDQVIGQYLRDC